MTKFESLVLKGLITIISMNILLIKSFNRGVIPDLVTASAKSVNEEIAQALIDAGYNVKHEYVE